MNNETITMYTLDEAREILLEEKRKNKRKLKYYIKQKILGFIAIVLGIIAPIMLDGDATISILFLPLGLYLFFTRKKVIQL
jgi:hypothetical protein